MLVVRKLCLSRQNYVRRRKHVFVATNICRNKHNFVATKLSSVFVGTKRLLSRQKYACRDKKRILVAAAANDRSVCHGNYIIQVVALTPAAVKVELNFNLSV